MYPSQKTEYRKQPINGGNPFTTGDIQLRINKMARSFLNPATLCINFRVAQKFKYGATAPTAGADAVALLGNALSFFSQQVVRSTGGQWQDTIVQPGLISNTIMNLTTNPVEKEGMISFGYNSTDGFVGYTNQGDIIKNIGTTGSTTELVYRSYSIPLMGVLNTHKLIPLFVDEHEINLTLNDSSKFIVQYLGTAGATYDGFQIEEVEIVADILTLDDAGFNELAKLYPNGMSIKTESYLYGTSSIPASGNGSYDITYAHGVNSLKKFIWWASPKDQWEGLYGGVNPNLQSWQLYIGSSAYPQLPCKSYSLAEVFYQNQKSFGSFYSTGHCGSVDRPSMAKCSKKGTGANATKYTQEYSNFTSAKPTLQNSTGVSASTYSNKFYNSLDVEIINQLKNNLYSGISTKGTSNLFRINVGEVLEAKDHTITFYSVYDAVLTYDWVNGEIRAST
jgi:hypothetical protein